VSTFARKFADAVHGVLGEAPTVDFALVAVARALDLPSGAALTLFAIGRTIGWIGHAIEQYEKNAIIRPRAKYVGALPTADRRFPVSEIASPNGIPVKQPLATGR